MFVTLIQDYLKKSQTIEEIKTEAEFASDLLRELGAIDVSVIHRACVVVATLQMFHAIEEHGEAALRNMIQRKPATFLTLLNALCNLTQSSINLDNHRLDVECR